MKINKNQRGIPFIPVLIVGLMVLVGVAMAEITTAIGELKVMTQTIIVGNKLLSELVWIIASGASVGIGFGIIIGAVIVYKRKKKAINSKFK